MSVKLSYLTLVHDRTKLKVEGAHRKKLLNFYWRKNTQSISLISKFKSWFAKYNLDIQEYISKLQNVTLFEKLKRKWKLHCVNQKGKFIILPPQEHRQGPRFKVSSEGLSPEIDILIVIRSPIQVLTEVAVA